MLASGLLVGAAGLMAGLANSIAGGGTLVTYPALLAAGLPPITANVTSAVGLVPGYAGGAVAYRRELEGQRSRFRFLAVPSVAGGILGALLLLVTPPETFEAVVPYLILLSCLLLALQPKLAAVMDKARPATGRNNGESTLFLFFSVLASAVYGSFFGAGLGILLLAVLGILVRDNLQRLNGMKSLLSLLVVFAGVIIYLISGQAHLPYVAILVITSYLGGAIGGAVARKISPRLLRLIICGLGIGVALALLIQG
jgi:uncharacterized protein